jgi:hypothetical protein
VSLALQEEPSRFNLESEEKAREAFEAKRKHPKRRQRGRQEQNYRSCFCQKPKAKDRFERKKTTDLRLRQELHGKKDSTNHQCPRSQLEVTSELSCRREKTKPRSNSDPQSRRPVVGGRGKASAQEQSGGKEKALTRKVKEPHQTSVSKKYK